MNRKLVRYYYIVNSKIILFAALSQHKFYIFPANTLHARPVAQHLKCITKLYSDSFISRQILFAKELGVENMRVTVYDTNKNNANHNT